MKEGNTEKLAWWVKASLVEVLSSVTHRYNACGGSLWKDSYGRAKFCKRFKDQGNCPEVAMNLKGEEWSVKIPEQSLRAVPVKQKEKFRRTQFDFHCANENFIWI